MGDLLYAGSRIYVFIYDVEINSKFHRAKPENTIYR